MVKITPFLFSDEDMQSMASLMSVNNNSDIAPLEDFEDEDMSLSDNSMKNSLQEVVNQVQLMTESLSGSDFASTPISGKNFFWRVCFKKKKLFFEVLQIFRYVLVASIQSFPKDDKTPTAETFSPISEKAKIPFKAPAPKQSDFPQAASDMYSELCSEQLENLEELEEETETTAVVPPPKIKSFSLKLQPLDLKENEPPKAQKLTTPGRFPY